MTEGRTVDVREQTATVHRYYVEAIDDIRCLGTPRFHTNPCEDAAWLPHPSASEYEVIMEHVHTFGHDVQFKMVDFCKASPVGNSLSPDAADFRELRKQFGDLKGE